MFKFASSWLKIVGHVTDFRHDVVVKVQVYDAESSPFLLREVQSGGQSAFQCWVQHRLTCWSPFDTDALPFPTRRAGLFLKCLTLRLPWYSVLVAMAGSTLHSLLCWSQRNSVASVISRMHISALRRMGHWIWLSLAPRLCHRWCHAFESQHRQTMLMSCHHVWISTSLKIFDFCSGVEPRSVPCAQRLMCRARMSFPDVEKKR